MPLVPVASGHANLPSRLVLDEFFMNEPHLQPLHFFPSHLANIWYEVIETTTFD